MKLISNISTLSLSVLFCINSYAAGIKPAPNGIEIPENYKDWKVISQSHRIDNNSLRIILGNDIAIKASREGKTKPWPNGAILGKMVWQQKNDEHWDKAIVPGQFVHAEFMVKDSKKYASTGGWGFARWKGMAQNPYGKDKNFVQECYACHTPVKNRDYVFTTPVTLPK